MRGKEVDIVKLLIENKDKELSISQIAKLLKKDYKNVHNIITRLYNLHIISIETFGKSNRIKLINKPHPLIFEAEYLRRNNLLKRKEIAIIYDEFKKISTKLYILLIFGSYAKNTQTKHSDIDLMFIVPDITEDKMEKEIQNITDSLPLKIHINIFKEKDFISMNNSKKLTVGSEAINKNIILHGIESYYEIIK